MSWLDSLLSYGSAPAGGVSANPELLKMNNYAAGPVPTGTTPTSEVAGGGFLDSLWGSMFDKTDANGIKTQGWGGLALSGLQGLGNSFMAMKQYGLAEDALKEQKRQFDMNFNAQRNLTNSQLSDRQRARVASNPGAYQSVGDYMKEYGV